VQTAKLSAAKLWCISYFQEELKTKLVACALPKNVKTRQVRACTLEILP
jgi:hypothetical protein